jgi:2-octaprenylphenol hydroxylase
VAGRHKFDVVIAGAGMVGATAANLLAQCGFLVALIEAHQPEAFDSESETGLRVSAISPGSQAILNEAGAWKEIEKQRHCPYRRMFVEERYVGSEDSAGLSFEAPVFGMERLGTIIENQLIQSSLWRFAGANQLIQIFCPAKLADIQEGDESLEISLDSGDLLEASLLIGADGATSAVRRKAGVKQNIWEYNQKGVVCVVRKSDSNPGTAWQRFLPGGPLAFLPLSDGRSSLVWTLPTLEADRVLGLCDADFSEELQEVSSDWLGDVIECGPRAAFPLLMRLSDHYVAGRVILLGDAAHVVHPLAGQGVNLGLADAAALVETLLENRKTGKDIADRDSLRKFESWRKSESEVMAAGIHGLRGIFQSAGLSGLRKIGMKLISRNWFIREAFLRRAAGQGRNAPRISRGEDIKTLLKQG